MSNYPEMYTVFWKGQAAALRVFSVALVMALFCLTLPRPASAGNDYPASCRDADAVLDSARHYTWKSNSWTWDQRRILQAKREFVQCLHDAADDLDRAYASNGFARASLDLGIIHETLARSTNILKNDSLSARRRAFNVWKQYAVKQYSIVVTLSRLTVESQNLNNSNASYSVYLKEFALRSLARMRAMTFATLPSYAVLVAPPVVRHIAKVKVRPTQPACANPNVQATTVRAIEPDTPPLAQQQGISGDVAVVVSLNAQGQVVSTKIQSSPSALLNEAALEAARQSTFQAEIQNCKPIAVDVIFTVPFSSQ